MMWNNARSIHRSARALALCAGLVVAACGGGSGGGGMSTPPPTVSMSVQPTEIVLGQSATLTWSSNSGTSCSASGGWTGSEPASGTQTVTPSATGTVTYTLACSGGAYSGSTSKSATLTVTAPSGFSTTKLVADGVGAQSQDANLVNAWGIAFGPTTPVWVANNHSETSTLYDGNGKPQPFSAPRVVHLQAGIGGRSFDPTGIVYNATADFVMTASGKSAAALFLFVGEGGMVAGWAPSVDAANAVNVYEAADGAVYKALAIASNGTGNFLYAADFHNNKIDVFDASFTKQTPSGTSFTFTDPTLPAGYAPFGIQAIKNGPGGTTQIYVAYAKQAPPDNTDEQGGAGLGLVDVYDANGQFVTHLITAGGLLNAPWGMALAPADVGTLSNALLVGNFTDGHINGYDPVTGAFIGTVQDSAGQAFAVPGLWGIAFGNDANNQPHNTLFYAAGTNDEVNGEYGRIDLGAPPILNAPPVVAVTAPAGSLSGTVTLSATVQDSIKIAKVEFFVNGATSLGVGVLSGSQYTVQWNTTALPDGSATVSATATDIDNNVGTSPGVTVTIANTTPAATLTQIQTQVFTPSCSGCHNGSQPAGGALPGSQNLTAGNSYSNLVNVASLEQPGLMRVKPGDPANSYIIRKLEGTAGISGERMPQGGPYLDQATIDMIKSWIASGAPNN